LDLIDCLKLYTLRNNLILEGKEDPNCYIQANLARFRLGIENIENKIIESFGLS
jgi:hypothetical protein